jgi:hypothetical protein
VLDRWFEARDASVGILVLGQWSKERGRGCPLMELSLTNEKFKAEKITVLTTQNMYKKIHNTLAK